MHVCVNGIHRVDYNDAARKYRRTHLCLYMALKVTCIVNIGNNENHFSCRRKVASVAADGTALANCSMSAGDDGTTGNAQYPRLIATGSWKSLRHILSRKYCRTRKPSLEVAPTTGVLNSGYLGVNTPKNLSQYAQILRRGRHRRQMQTVSQHIVN